MKLNKLLFVITCVLLTALGITLFSACDSEGLDPNNETDIKIVAENKTNVPEGEYTVIYSIENMSDLTSKYGLIVTLKITDDVGKDVAVTDNKSFTVVSGKQYNVEITATLTSGKITKKSFSITAVGSAAITKFLVEFVVDNDVIASHQVESGSDIPAVTPNAPNGYAFAYWFISSDSTQSEFTDKVTSHLRLKAKFNLIEFTVTFDPDGGELSKLTQTTDYTKNFMIKPITPLKLGYTFTYWYITGDEDKTEVDFTDYIVAQNMSLTAVYTKDVYTITFVDNDKVTTVTTGIDNDFIVDEPLEPSRDDFIFLFWQIKGATSSQDKEITDFSKELFYSNATVEAIYEPITMTVIYLNEVLDEGSGKLELKIVDITTTQKLYDYKALLPIQLPVKADYVLEGWYLKDDETKKLFNFNNTVLTEDISLVAKWTEKLYYATFDSLIDGSKIEVISTTISQEFKIYKPNNPVKTGYEFAHWYLITDEHKMAFDFTTTEVKSDIELVAFYEVKPVTVTFIAENPLTKEQFFTTKTVTDITKKYLTTPPSNIKCEGFILDYFYTFTDGMNEDGAIAFDFKANGVAEGSVFKAKMKAVIYRVEFYDKENKNSSYRILGFAVEGTIYGVTLKDITAWENYTTCGWVLNIDGSGEVWTDTTSIKSNMLSNGAIKLYSVKTPTEYDVTFAYIDENGADVSIGELRKGTVNGVAHKILPTAPTRDYYNFTGWYAYIKGVKTAITADYLSTKISVTANMTIYASYARYQCAVDFYFKLGDTVRMSNITKDYEYILTANDFPNAPFTREGYFANDGEWGRLVDGKLVKVDAGYKLETNEALYLMWNIIDYNVNVLIKNGDITKEFTTIINILSNNLFINPEKTISQDPTLYEFTKGYMLNALYRNYSNDSGYTNIFNHNSETINSDITLYAEYVQKNLTLNFYNEGILLQSSVVPYNADFNVALLDHTQYKKEKHATLGWYIYANNDVLGDKIPLTAEYIKTHYVTQALDIYLHYTPIVHTITINLGNGQDPIVLTTTFENSYLLNKPSNPIRNGHRFGGWILTNGSTFDFATFAPKNENIAENITVAANWTKITYSVTFKSDNGSPNKTVIVDYLTNYVLQSSDISSPTKFGYSFKHWTMSDTEFDITKAINSNTELTASYTKLIYSVTFYYENGDMYTIKNGAIDGIIGEMPSLSKIDYLFEGWYTSSGVKYTSTSQYTSEGLKLYPRFIPVEYTITFETGIAGLNPKPYTTSILYGFMIERPTITYPTKYLEGWYKTKNGNTLSDRFDFHSQLKQNITLHANWRDKTEESSNYITEDYYVKSYNKNGDIVLTKYKAIVGLTDAGKLLLDITIPSTIDQLTVGEIRSNAFVGANAKTITIKSFINIGVGAFSAARELESIFISYEDRLLPFNDTLFVDCLALTNIFVPTSLLAIYAERYTFNNAKLVSIDEFGNELVVVNDVTYLLTKNAAYIKSYPKNLQTKTVIIPESIYGLPVQHIMDNAFENGQFAEIILPNTLLSIGNYAFQNCMKLENIKIPTLVKSIGSLAFGYCDRLLTVYFDCAIPPTVDGLIFSEAKNLTSIFVHDKLVNVYKAAIPNYENFVKSDTNAKTVVALATNGGETLPIAYYDKDTLINSPTPVRYGYNFSGWYTDANAELNKFDFTKTVSLGSKLILYAGWTINTNIIFKTADVKVKTPTGFTFEVMITGLSDYANSTLKTINIPNMIDGKKVKYIHNLAFSKSTSLKEITVSSENIFFMSIDGVLFSTVNGTKTPSSLIYYPNQKNIIDTSNIFTIPDGVTKIEQYAFYKSNHLAKVIIPESVESIGAYAFSESVSLSDVTFSGKSRLSAIEQGTFAKCRSLGSIIIPELVFRIGETAFYDCINLISIEFTTKSTPMLTIASNAFSPASASKDEQMKLSTVFLPKGTSSLYESILAIIKASTENNKDLLVIYK